MLIGLFLYLLIHTNCEWKHLRRVKSLIFEIWKLIFHWLKIFSKKMNICVISAQMKLRSKYTLEDLYGMLLPYQKCEVPLHSDRCLRLWKTQQQCVQTMVNYQIIVTFAFVLWEIDLETGLPTLIELIQWSIPFFPVEILDGNQQYSMLKK